jgi:hypothetical protein
MSRARRLDVGTLLREPITSINPVRRRARRFVEYLHTGLEPSI